MAVVSKDEIQEVLIRRLLRCAKTHRYFTGAGWTDSVEEAQTYANEVDAVRACVQNGLKDVELVLRIRNTARDIFCTSIR